MAERFIYEIAEDIYRDWKKPSPYAKPYLEAMLSLGSPSEMYGQDSAKSIVLYFLSNARSYRGPQAQKLKSELKKRMGIK